MYFVGTFHGNSYTDQNVLLPYLTPAWIQNFRLQNFVNQVHGFYHCSSLFNQRCTLHAPTQSLQFLAIGHNHGCLAGKWPTRLPAVSTCSFWSARFPLWLEIHCGSRIFVGGGAASQRVYKVFCGNGNFQLGHRSCMMNFRRSTTLTF
jgi:hypothetical protein